MEQLSQTQVIALALLFALVMISLILTSISIVIFTLTRSRVLPRVHEPSQSFTQKHRRWFISLVIAQALVATGTALLFAILTSVKGGFWLVYFSGSVVLSSMLRESLWLSSTWNPRQRSFAPRPLLGLLTFTSISFFAGVILSGYFFNPGMKLAAASAITYRAWIIWEWARVVSDTINDQTFELHLMVRVFAFGGTILGLQPLSRVNGLLHGTMRSGRIGLIHYPNTSDR
ncbi:hypothetical protein BGZ61DRAFT_567045 [Ilyonectria robusta]|uniref:uncharacterized protein n=1 Tax=Ilyonectria robusta TaxID=1079257 RepID=UPI001E8DBBB7|nr:uncharacterized protein BGZ61DRAFT_567045 [Ilyonectria robusta]KAH8659504.1 hypothetical protein BGZ61DRAFT_567045 [Ilyonectria robusta]